MKFKKSARVQWNWLGRSVKGKVLESFAKPVMRVIKGKEIKRNGSAENPAYLVISESGNRALKLGSELKSATKTSRVTPKMFS